MTVRPVSRSAIAARIADVLREQGVTPAAATKMPAPMRSSILAKAGHPDAPGSTWVVAVEMLAGSARGRARL